MNNALATSNNAIIEDFMPLLEERIHSTKIAKGEKHFRTRNPKRSRVKAKYVGGEITKIVIGTNRGEVLGAQKGVGKYPEKRVAKGIFTEPMDEMIPELANDIAINSGDIIGASLANLR